MTDIISHDHLQTLKRGRIVYYGLQLKWHTFIARWLFMRWILWTLIKDIEACAFAQLLHCSTTSDTLTMYDNNNMAMTMLWRTSYESFIQIIILV